jgi:hypothetical protein
LSALCIELALFGTHMLRLTLGLPFCRKEKGEVVAAAFGYRIMAGTLIEDCTGDGKSSSTEELPSDQQSHSGDSLVEWRSSEQVENGTPSTSPAYSDSDDDDCGTL